MKFPEITDYVALRDAAIEELRKQKLNALCKQYPNKKIFVTKDMKVYILK